MDVAHFDRFFVLAAAGLGLMLAGGVNLVLGAGGRRAWLRVPLTAALAGAIVAVMAAFSGEELATRTAGILAAVLLTAFLVGSDKLSHWVATAGGFLRRPAPRWAVVALGGLVVLFGSGLAFDVEDQSRAEQALQDLDLEAGRSPTRPSESGCAAAELGTPVILKEPLQLRDPKFLGGLEAKVLLSSGHATKVVRRGAAADHSNCHGWVFTGGKFLLSPDDVEQILKDNGYQAVQEPRVGDLVVYRQVGLVAHTAVVRYVTEGQPVIVEGKWGAMGVFLHPAEESCYGTEYTFHRSVRAGHLLVGLGGSPTPGVVQPMAAE